MKKYTLIGIACVALLMLTSCSNNSSFYKAQVRNDLVKENWMPRINTDPDRWTTHASSWFFNSEPGKFDDYASKAPPSRAITAMMIRVPDFTDIKVDGPYRIQISGELEHNNVFVLGPNDAARHTTVDINGNMLYVHPATDCKGCAPLNEVIIRIGIHDLRRIIAMGTATIEGKHIVSSSLDIQATNRANVLLAGSMNLCNLSHAGTGTVTVIGAQSPSLGIKISGDGDVNLSGHIGIERILKQGRGTLNIVGADSDSLKINSMGTGIITIAGFVNLKKIDVTDYSKVYLYWVNSNGIYINVHHGAQLGLAGSATNLDIEIDGSSRFWGKFLRAENIYIRTRHSSHANISPYQKLFATALDNSSIYFFTTPNIVSRYSMDNGVIIPVWCDTCATPISLLPQTPPPPATTVFKERLSYKGEGSFKDETYRRTR